MSKSPTISDPGYGSNASSPWLSPSSPLLLELEHDHLSESPQRFIEAHGDAFGPGHVSPQETRASHEVDPVDNKDTTYETVKRANVPFLDSVPYWLGLYFFFNLSLTLYNKAVLASFPFPWSLTCMHSLCAAIGSFAAYKRGYFKRSSTLTARDQLVLVAYSSLYTVNIAVSNLSLNLVSVALHQVIRSTGPIFTILITLALFNKQYQLRTYLSLVPVIVGVGLATYGDYACTTWGLILTLLGALLASVKGVSTNKLLVGPLKLHPLDLLLRMSPLAFGQCLVFACLSGEASQIYERTFVEETLSWSAWGSLIVNGSLAFGLNVVSFTGNKKTGPLTMGIAANVKQVLTIGLAILIFDLAVNGINLVGIASTITGGAYYSYIEYSNKQQQSALHGIEGESTAPLLPTSSPTEA